jgi:hypothetical protein
LRARLCLCHARLAATKRSLTCCCNTRMRAAAYQADRHTGKVLEGYVADSCSDGNYWCQRDTNHLDLSKPLLQRKGLLDPSWNGRKVEWAFTDGPTSECAPRLDTPRSLLHAPHVDACVVTLCFR